MPVWTARCRNQDPGCVSMGAIQRGTSWATIPKTLNRARTVHAPCAHRARTVQQRPHALVQATVGVGTVIIPYIGVAYTRGGGVIIGLASRTYPPPLYKLRPCPSYSRRRVRNNCVRNFNCVQNVVRPHKTWVCRHICQLHGAMDTCNMPHARQAHSQEFEVVRAQTSP